MGTVYDIEISNDAVKENLERICNSIFKLLPMREEEKDWIKPLETITIETLGYANLVTDQPKAISLACKLQGLLSSGEEVDFMLFRRTIFEACGIVNEIKSNVN